MADEPQAITPHLKITGLHLAGYRSIKRLDLPEDGIGWAGKVPDIMLVGGANGSGKTTLLEGLFSVFAGLDHNRLHEGMLFPGAEELRIDLSVRSKELGGTRELRLVRGKDEYVQANTSPDCYSIPVRGESKRLPETWGDFLDAAMNVALLVRGVMPRVLYFPTDRQLAFPASKQRNLEPPPETSAMAWRFKPAEDYKDSLLGQLTWARFEDLSNKDEGRPPPVSGFEDLGDAFRRFVDDSKELVWQGTSLRVRTSDGVLHALPDLSSGEKQVLLFAAELRRRWTPGSLVLIDEPELHLHAAWQSTLFQLITDLQRERGGQVIITTQSNHLFGLGEPATKVVLRRGWP